MPRPARPKSFSGRVQLPNGTPAEGATVYLCATARDLRFTDDKPNEHSPEELSKVGVVTTDPDGRFQFVAPDDDPRVLVIVHENGFDDVPDTELDPEKPIALLPWAHVDGVAMCYDRPGGTTQVHVCRSSPTGPYFDYKPDLDEKGYFSLRVPPGQITISMNGEYYDESERITRMGSGYAISVEPESGETAHCTLGGYGVRIIGRIASPSLAQPDAPHPFRESCCLYLSREPISVPEEVLKDEQAYGAWIKAWHKSPEGRARMAVPGRYHAALYSDGRFRIDDVAPGTYQLRLTMHPEQKTYESRKIVVPPPVTPASAPSAIGRSPTNTDLGNVQLHERKQDRRTRSQ